MVQNQDSAFSANSDVVELSEFCYDMQLERTLQIPSSLYMLTLA